MSREKFLVYSGIVQKSDILCACFLNALTCFIFFVKQTFLPLGFLIKRTALHCTASIRCSNCFDFCLDAEHLFHFLT